jgi:hypothetical protein
MKNSKIVLLLTAAFILCFSSCQNDLVPVPDNDVYQYSDGDDLLKKGKISRTVPFKARHTVYPELLEVTVDGDMVFLMPATGNATHLGKCTWLSNSTVYANTPLPWKQTGDVVFEKKGTGDQLIGFFEGISEPDLSNNSFFGSGDYWITSGTGKFESVTGSGTYSYAGESENVAVCTFTGTLTFPAK